MSGISWPHCSGGGEGGCDEELGPGAVTTFRVISFMATAAVGRGARAPWVSVTGGVMLLLLPRSLLWLRSQSRCHLPCRSQVFCGVRCCGCDPGFQVPPPLVPRSCLLCVFRFTHSFFFFGHAVCGILVPQQGSKQFRPLAVRVWHPDYWTAREFSVCPVLCTVVQMCGNLSNPGVLDRDIFTELRIFYY